MGRLSRHPRAGALESARRVALLLGLAGVLAACGSAHRATYSGHLYSVAEVERAFAAIGLQLHRDSTPSPGVVELVNNRRLGPELIPSPPRFLTVFVATRRTAIGSWAAPAGLGRSYANVSAYSKGGDPFDEVAGAIYTLRWGTRSQLIGPVHLGERRSAVEKALGPGSEKRRGIVTYFGGRLLVDYWYHDRLYNGVAFLQTSSPRFHTRSGIHVGSNRQDLNARAVRCANETGWCTALLSPMPDGLGMGFRLVHGKVVSIEIGSA